MLGGGYNVRRTVKTFGRRYNIRRTRKVWRVEGENKKSRRTSGEKANVWRTGRIGKEVGDKEGG